jgi:dimethylhistidine N-methyltransferase
MAIHEPEISTELNREFMTEVFKGLTSTPKKLSPKFFYDQRGSELFEQICELEEYYPTRTETQILENSIGEIRKAVGKDCLLYEFGSGSSTKTRILLDHLEQIQAYLPIDISGEFLLQSARTLREAYPELNIHPICADFTKKLPTSSLLFPFAKSKVGFLPGSTIGNFTPQEASLFLGLIADQLGADGKLLIGIDLVKDIHTLESAYNDSKGVTAEFNLNVIHRMRNELDIDIDPANFEHHAYFNPNESRVEMHLYSKKPQSIFIDGTEIHFQEGESIHTENSYKYTPAHFEYLAGVSGFEVEKIWTDPHSYFGVFLLKTVSDRHEFLRTA